MTETVTVPRELLRVVLLTAQIDSKIAEWHSRVEANWEADRARIAELRKAAGLDE